MLLAQLTQPERELGVFSGDPNGCGISCISSVEHPSYFARQRAKQDTNQQ
jgi:hypothetical protein